MSNMSGHVDKKRNHQVRGFVIPVFVRAHLVVAIMCAQSANPKAKANVLIRSMPT